MKEPKAHDPMWFAISRVIEVMIGEPSLLLSLKHVVDNEVKINSLDQSARGIDCACASLSCLCDEKSQY